MAYLSIYKGIVADRKDPEKRGRLQLKVPDLWGDDIHEYWAESKGLFNGNGMGFMAIPELGETVWVQFEAGDFRFPVWEYGPWSVNKGLSTVYDGDGEPTKVTLRTANGHFITIDNKADSIEITQKDGASIKLVKDNISLIESKSISIGSDGKSAEPGVLGDANEQALTTIHDILNNVVSALKNDITASAGQPYLLFPASSAAAVVQALVSLTQLTSQIKKTKSNKVTLD